MHWCLGRWPGTSNTPKSKGFANNKKNHKAGLPSLLRMNLVHVPLLQKKRKTRNLHPPQRTKTHSWAKFQLPQTRKQSCVLFLGNFKLLFSDACKNLLTFCLQFCESGFTRLSVIVCSCNEKYLLRRFANILLSLVSYFMCTVFTLLSIVTCDMHCE